jgi:hypothetical protein
MIFQNGGRRNRAAHRNRVILKTGSGRICFGEVHNFDAGLFQGFDASGNAVGGRVPAQAGREHAVIIL